MQARLADSFDLQKILSAASGFTESLSRSASSVAAAHHQLLPRTHHQLLPPAHLASPSHAPPPPAPSAPPPRTPPPPRPPPPPPPKTPFGTSRDPVNDLVSDIRNFDRSSLRSASRSRGGGGRDGGGGGDGGGGAASAAAARVSPLDFVEAPQRGLPPLRPVDGVSSQRASVNRS